MQRLKTLRDAVVSNDDLLTEILLRVPAKPLTRFKCVSKCWCALISDPLFGSNHALQNSNSTPVLTISEKNQREICKYLFKHGVCVAMNCHFQKHHGVDVTDLEVIRLMRSFKSKGYVRQSRSASRTFPWYEWRLTDDGIKYLRTYLNLPLNIMPVMFDNYRHM